MQSRTTDADLDCAFVVNALPFAAPKIGGARPPLLALPKSQKPKAMLTMKVFTLDHLLVHHKNRFHIPQLLRMFPIKNSLEAYS